MKISDYAIQQIGALIIGAGGYKSGRELVDWFNKYGIRDVYDNYGLPPNPNNKGQRLSRSQYVQYSLERFNNTENLKHFLEDFINRNKYIVEKIREFVEPEGFQIMQFDKQYTIVGCGQTLVNNGITDARFEKIQTDIIRHINEAKLSIHIAMAWFTNQTIADALKEKAKDNVDVKLVINQDYTNVTNGADLSGLCYKFIKAKNGGIMHNKFCVIDNRIVITGSYNWSVKAETKNDENILIDTNIDTVMKFSVKFKNLFFDE